MGEAHKARILPQDRIFDLRGLSEYSSLGVSTLRICVQARGLPAFKLAGKILIRKSDFDGWLNRYRLKGDDLDRIVDEALDGLKEAKSDK